MCDQLMGCAQACAARQGSTSSIVTLPSIGCKGRCCRVFDSFIGAAGLPSSHSHPWWHSKCHQALMWPLANMLGEPRIVAVELWNHMQLLVFCTYLHTKPNMGARAAAGVPRPDHAAPHRADRGGAAHVTRPSCTCAASRPPSRTARSCGWRTVQSNPAAWSESCDLLRHAVGSVMAVHESAGTHCPYFIIGLISF